MTEQQYIRPPAGYFKYVLAIDCETTGLDWDSDDPSIGHQAVSWGIVVADAETLIPVEELYVEIKWNEASKQARLAHPEFSTKASDIHKLTFDYLEQNGVTEQEAVVQILELILKYWGPTQNVKCLGHNVLAFDVPFLRAMFRRHGIEVKFGSRHYDTNSIGWAMTGAFVSDAFFSTMGFTDRDGHNALEDAKQALEATRRLRVIWKDTVGLRAYE